MSCENLEIGMCGFGTLCKGCPNKPTYFREDAKESLLYFLNREKEKADDWVEKNTVDGFPDAIAGWRCQSALVARWIEIVENA